MGEKFILHRAVMHPAGSMFSLKGQCVRLSSILMVREHIANGVNVNPGFVMSHLTSFLYQLWVKSQSPQQTHVQGCCRYVMVQHGCHHTSGPAPYVSVKAYYWCMKAVKYTCISFSISSQ